MLPSGYESLVEKYGADILAAGQALLEARRRSAGIVSTVTQPACPDPVKPPKDLQDDLLACKLAVEARQREIRTVDDYNRFVVRASLPELPKPPEPESYKPGPAKAADDLNQAKILPLLGIKADQDKGGGAWRLWVLAKYIDRVGSGIIYRKDLEESAQKFGIHSRSLARWLADSIKRKWLVDITRRDHKTLYRIVNPAHVAEGLGITRAGSSWAVIDIRQILGEGWKPIVWASFLAGLPGPVSRETLFELTGVPVRTQTHYESQSSIQYTHNIAVSNRPADHTEGMQEAHSSAFEFTDYKRGRKTFTAWRLPDTRHVPIFVASRTGSRGRLRKINHTLSNTSLLSEQQASSEDVVRLFYDDYKKAERCVRQLRRQGNCRQADEVYSHRLNGKQSRIFDVLGI